MERNQGKLKHQQRCEVVDLYRWVFIDFFHLDSITDRHTWGTDTRREPEKSRIMICEPVLRGKKR